MYYLAGFADGEGCFRFNGTTCASVTNSYPWVLQVFQHIWGGTIRKKKKNRSMHKQVYEWEVTGPKARAYSKDIRPYLREKWRQADAIVRMMSYPLRSEERREFIRQLKVLKHYEYIFTGELSNGG